MSNFAKEKVKAYIERIERLEEEKRGLAEDVKEIYAEAKGNGFDPKIMRAVIRRRRMDKSARDEFDELVDLYEGSLEELLS